MISDTTFWKKVKWKKYRDSWLPGVTEEEGRDGKSEAQRICRAVMLDPNHKTFDKAHIVYNTKSKS